MAGDDAAVATGTPQSESDITVSVLPEHCPHVPCPNTSHNHLPGGCVGHSFVSTAALETPGMAVTDGRVAFEHDDASGRTLLPPVPPPLA